MSQSIPPPPPPRGGFYHMVIAGYLDHQSTQFRLSAGELLLFVSVVLVLINALFGIPNCNDLVSYQLIYYDKKRRRKKAISIYYSLFEQFDILQLSVCLCLKCVLVTGHCGRRNIKVPSVKKPRADEWFPLKARCRSEYSQVCLVSAIICFSS